MLTEATNAAEAALTKIGDRLDAKGNKPKALVKDLLALESQALWYVNGTSREEAFLPTHIAFSYSTLKRFKGPSQGC